MLTTQEMDTHIEPNAVRVDRGRKMGVAGGARCASCGVVVHWRYDRRNERVAELADEFREDLDFPFEIVPFDA